MKNIDLKKIYDESKLNWHSGFNESMMLVQMIPKWQGLDVLEIGCGEGHLASILRYAGAKNIHAIDYSGGQIKRAEENYPKLDFFIGSFHLVNDYDYDVVVMQGVLEHLDKPWIELKEIMDRCLKPNGKIILSVPHWINPRGFIYLALRLLFDAPMSLTDLHFFLPDDFDRFAKQYNLQMEFASCDNSWAAGDELLWDFADRIPKAMPDIKQSNISIFLNYIDRMLQYYPKDLPLAGACLGVKISRNK